MKNGGSGVYIKYPDGDTTSLSVPGGFQCSNCRAEILVICTAAEHLLESGKNTGSIAIFTDSLSTLQALNSADPDQITQDLHSSLAKLTAQFTVSLQWVPAHVGLTGNETAGRLVKFGSQAPQTQNPVTYRETKTLLHSRYNGDWKKEKGGYQAHLDPIWRLEWAQQTTIFRLRTGHCGLSAHLKRTGISDTSLCECGHADQTLDHVLQSCPIYIETSANMAAGCWSGDQAVGLGRRPLLDGWNCGINRTEDLTYTAVDRWRRRRSCLQDTLVHYLFLFICSLVKWGVGFLWVSPCILCQTAPGCIGL